ncbi:BTAD domain-containing putative transcriptional regulator [Micromonospora sp. NPDC048999]|uniref:BTAD domain-containing putative transcriptional regulator n=1 Tax=Micromonospora sp. NPDC048999 TaxID=3155391 RepID=UPI0033CDFFEC
MGRDEIAAALAASLPALRRQAGWTQQQLAERAQVSIRTIRAIERGAAGRLHATTVDRLATALGLREPALQPGRGGLRIELLGPLRVRQDGAAVDVPARLPRTLLGLLALRARQPVLREEIVDLLWGANPPRSCLNLVHGYVGRLRLLLEPGRAPHAPAATILAATGGYLLDVPTGAIDLDDFDAALADADRDAGDPSGEAALLAAALGRWRGPVLADAEPRLRAHPAAVAAGQRRLTAALRYADAALALGHHHDVVTMLHPLTYEEPLHESLHARLLLALAGAGQQATALDRYAQLCARLRDELGVDPGPELTSANLKVLRQQVTPDVPALPVRPAQLPRAVAGFAGRRADLARLDRMLSNEQAPPACVVSGPPGVGKSALAAHWAHRVRDRFPDGQLFVDLQGFGPGRDPLLPTEVLRQFLEALDVPGRRMPTSANGKIGLYRSLLADRRMLIVLDNARDADQVRPLLPGGPGNAVVVTSRSQLPGLVADGACPVTLDSLPSADARQLLDQRLGPARTAAEPTAVTDIIDSCAGLPLALAIVTARAASYARFPLAALAEELSRQRGLDPFDTGETGIGIRTIFSWSYDSLRPPAARMFRLFSLHRGPDLTVPMAASILGATVDRVRPWLVELARAHLITETAPGRYRMHDLLRAYSEECAADTDPSDEPAGPLPRLLDHALHTAWAAARIINPHRDPIELTPVRDGVTVQRLTDHDTALSWFGTERANLLALVRHAADSGFHQHAWQLAWTLIDNLDRHGLWAELTEVQTIGLRSARRVGDTLGQAHAHYGAARAAVQLGRHDDAEWRYRAALAFFESMADRAGEARVRIDLAWVLYRIGVPGQAVLELDRAFELYRAAHRRDGQARAINNLGWVHEQLGNHRRAIVHCGMALRLHQELDNAHGQASALDTLGLAHHRLGDQRRAVAYHEQALELFRLDGDRYGEAGTGARLGDAYHAVGDDERAEQAWRAALPLLDELGLPDAARVRAELAGIAHTDAA